MRKLIIVVGLLVASAMAGCGSETTLTCCVNGAFYNCSSTSDQQSCAEKCSRDSSKDDTCK